MTKKTIELLLIRHGKTAGNMEHRYIGITDEPLAAQGVMEIQRKWKALDLSRFERVFASPMLRCRETAGLLWPGATLCLIPEWKEMDFGLFEGKNYRDLNGNTFYQAWIDSGGRLAFPGGESREDFIARTQEGLHHAISMLSSGQCAAAVVHGGTIMAMLSGLTGEEYFSFQTGNGEAFLLKLEEVGGRIRILEYERK